jgi:hypothetical protein
MVARIVHDRQFLKDGSAVIFAALFAALLFSFAIGFVVGWACKESDWK